jgi:ABC-type uncharacterized transport system permease subunit
LGADRRRLKTRRGAPEIITTIMLNYIALQMVAVSLQMPDNEGAAHGWLLERAQSQPHSDVLPEQAQLPALLADPICTSGFSSLWRALLPVGGFSFAPNAAFCCALPVPMRTRRALQGIAWKKKLCVPSRCAARYPAWAARWK